MPPSHLLLALAVVFVWGTNFVVIKLGLAELPPFLFATLRFLLSAFPFVLLVRRPDGVFDRRAVDLASGRNPDPRITRHAAAAEAVIAGLPRPDFVIANPPRTGMDGAVVDAIATRRPSRLAYISCDPATLARDLHRLGPGWKVRAMEAFDLFPQTAHIETVTLVEPA